MSEAVHAALAMVLSGEGLLSILAGVLVGLVVGCVPGLNVTMAMILLLPFTFSLEPASAVGLLMGIYISAMTAGAVPPVLLGIPGVPSSAATVMDGYALCRQGRAGKALGVAMLVGIVGGLIGVVLLMVSAPLIARVALNFGPAELFAVVLFGLASISEVTGMGLVKSLIAGGLGLMLTTIGMDPLLGTARYNFGSAAPVEVDLVAAMLGVFAIPRVIEHLVRHRGQDTVVFDPRVSAELPTWAEFRGLWWVLLLASLIGVLSGAIPGPGGPVAVFLSYDLVRRLSRHPDPPFGQGNLAGVAAPEAANNAITAGALIPMLTLGVPGEPPAAVLMGALLIHGLRPGPLLFQQNASFVYSIFLAMLVGNLLSLFISVWAIRLYVNVLRIPKAYLMPVILVLAVVGSYSIGHNMVDVYVMLGLGLVSYLLEKGGFPTMPMVLGLVLGGTAESEFRRALILSAGDYTVFLRSPISLVFLVAAFLWVLGPTLWQVVRGLRPAATASN